MLVGIDLGTTNSAVAVWRDNAAHLIPNALGHYLTPSAVSVDPSGQAWIGQAALERLTTHPEHTATSFKRFMGSARTTPLGSKGAWRAEDLSALVLQSLCGDVEAATGERPTAAVITVPAYFNDKQRKATRRAGELAGLEVRRLINEPTAAALAFGLTDRGDREPFLVFDLGGGTFDVSVVELFDGIVEVRASAGDNRLGGDDFDAIMAKLVEPEFQGQGFLACLAAEQREALMLRAGERARRALSETDEAEFIISVDGNSVTARVTAAEFENACAPLLARMREPVVRALRDCQIPLAELSDVVLVGGATRMPVVRKAITRMFGRFPSSAVHPDHAVALGAAMQAGLLDRAAGLEEIRITDIAPFTMGVDVTETDHAGRHHQGLFSPIIQRNTPVPVSREHSFSTVTPGQRQVLLGIFQGEARLVQDNLRLGEIAVPTPHAGPKLVEVRVRFTYDSSGLLEVDVLVPDTGHRENLVIADEEERENTREFAQRRAALAKLKIHPRDEQENAALLLRGERCWQSFGGEERDAIGHWMLHFTSLLDAQEPRAIADARVQIADALDRLEARSPL